MKFDERWKMKYTTEKYLSVFFILPLKEIVLARDKWKDFIMRCMEKRENGENLYNSNFVPENNVDNI